MAAPDKTIALLGATGGAGSVFLETALENGWHIRALVRNPKKMTIQDDKLTLIQGSFSTDMNKLEECIQGASYVVNMAGAITNVKEYPTDLQLNLVKALQPMMSKAGTKVFIQNAGGLAFLDGESPPCMAKFVRCVAGGCHPTLKRALEDHEQTFKYLQTSGMLTNESYGVICPRPMSFDAGKSKGKLKVSAAGAMGTLSIDVAQFYLDNLNNKGLYGKFPLLSY